jgi:hypothetical protein
MNYIIETLYIGATQKKKKTKQTPPNRGLPPKKNKNNKPQNLHPSD